MDWHLTLLLVAIAATYFAWRRAQRQSALERARAATLEEPRWRYTLVEVPAGEGLGAGYALATPNGTGLEGAVDWNQHGLAVLDVDADGDVTATLDAGDGVRLVPIPGPAGPMVEVRDEDGVHRAGAIHGQDARLVTEMIAADELSDCVVLRGPAPGGHRIRLLLVHRDTDVEA